jgi:hypothetical protein
VSAKAAVKALEAYRKTATPLDERYLKIMRALDEVEAIERAAKAWAASDHGELPEDLGDLMESIAKEAS